MLNPRVLALAAAGVGAGAVMFLTSGQNVDSSPAGPPAQPVAVPPVVTEAPPAAKPVMAAQKPAPASAPSTAPSARPSASHPVAKPVPSRKATPKRAATPSTLPPAYSETDLGDGWTAYCSNGYQQPDGSCSSRPEGYRPPAAPANNPCSGTGTECLNATLGPLGIYNGIPGLLGGR